MDEATTTWTKSYFRGVSVHKSSALAPRLKNMSYSAIQFALNLYQYHSLSLSDAYARAVTQFRALRSEHHIATTFAVMEATELGSTFSSEVEGSHEMFKKTISTWERRAELDEGALAARKRWKAIVDKNQGGNQWTKGEQYVRLWQEGARPNYMPSLTQATVEGTSESTPAPKPVDAPKTTPKKVFRSRRPRDFLGVHSKKP